MYPAINGIYENGQIILQESAPTQNKMKVLIVFIEDIEKTINKSTDTLPSFSKRWKGQFKLNESTEDAKFDYLKQRYQL